MICQNCGQENSAEASVCKNCGAAIARRTLASPALSLSALLSGLVAGAVATVFIWFGGAGFLSGVGAPSHEEFGVSQRAAWFYLATLLITCAALTVLFLRPIVKRMNDKLRFFLLAALFVVLGGMSLCSYLSSSSLFLKA